MKRVFRFLFDAAKSLWNTIGSFVRAVWNTVSSFMSAVWDVLSHMSKPALCTLLMLFVVAVDPVLAQSFSGTDYSAGTSALEEVATQIAAYVPYVVNLCYAVAGVVAIVGAISVYIAMNNDDNDVKKKIMMTVGACIFLIAAAKGLPLFFGIS